MGLFTKLHFQFSIGISFFFKVKDCFQDNGANIGGFTDTIQIIKHVI